MLTSWGFVAELGSPTGIRFSDVTDTSATVHWMVPKARVDNYRVAYVPADGGLSLVETFCYKGTRGVFAKDI